jgi:hypothetical protein
MDNTYLLYELKGQVQAYEKIINILIQHLSKSDKITVAETIKLQKPTLEEKLPEKKENDTQEIVLKEIKRQIRAKSAKRKSRSSRNIDDLEKKIKEKKQEKINSIFDISEYDCDKIYDVGKLKTKSKRARNVILENKHKLLKYNTIGDYYRKIYEIYTANGDCILDDFEKRWFYSSAIYTTLDDKSIDKYKLGFELSFQNILKKKNIINKEFCENFKFPLLCYFNINDILKTFEIQLSTFFIYNNSTFYTLETIEEDKYIFNEDKYLRMFIQSFTYILIEFMIELFTNTYKSIYKHNEYIETFSKEGSSNSLEFRQLLQNMYILSSHEFKDNILSIFTKKCSREFYENETITIYHTEEEEEDYEQEYTIQSILEQLFTNYKKDMYEFIFH